MSITDRAKAAVLNNMVGALGIDPAAIMQAMQEFVQTAQEIRARVQTTEETLARVEAKLDLLIGLENPVKTTNVLEFADNG